MTAPADLWAAALARRPHAARVQAAKDANR
jgi:hypothetical protein